jgi:hypothetical protein
MVPSIARDSLSLDSIDPICSEVNVGLRTYLISSKEESETHKKPYQYPDCVSITYQLLRELSAFWMPHTLDKVAVCSLSDEI